MRTVPSGLLSAAAGTPYKLANIVKITRQDQVVIRLTDAVTNVIIGSEVYRSDVGFVISSTMTGLNLADLSGVTFQCGMGEGGLTRDDIRSRRYYGATVEVSEVDWTAPETTSLLRFRGIVGRTTWTQSGIAEVEVMPRNGDKLIADEVYSQTCRASLGDAECGFPIESFRVDFTVTSVDSDNVFSVDTFGPTAAATPGDDTFSQGQLQWTSGDNELWSADILASTFVDKTIFLFFPMPSEIQVGDTGKMYPGCDRQFSTCINRFANWLNFRGEPYAPQGSLGL